MIERDELGAWLRLLESPGVGRGAARAWLAAFGSPAAVAAATPAARREVVRAPAAETAGASTPELEALIDATWRWLHDTSATSPRTVLVLGDPRYPMALLESPDPPLLLYAQGRVELLGAASIAIVGSRNPTPQGLANARAFAAQLAASGLTVVSGMALGIDGAAHLGALESPAASTIAVVGTGLDVVYPRRHLALARRIAVEGLIVGEYALGTPSLAQNFPRRNRLIAGLARGTLVVEAALQSGSLITARLANEAGRDVYAIPGSIHSPQSRGCHALIKQGAKLVEDAADVLEEWQDLSARADRAGAPPVPAVRPTGSAGDGAAPSNERDGHAGEDPDTRRLLAALGHDPVTLDQLVERTGRGAAELGAALLLLEFDGRVARLPGQRFQHIVAGR